MKTLVVSAVLAALAIPAMAVAQDTMQPIPNPPPREHHRMMHSSKHHNPHHGHHHHGKTPAPNK